MHRGHGARGAGRPLKGALSPPVHTGSVKHRVLLVEDDEKLGQQVVASLTEAGYDAAWLKDGRLVTPDALQGLSLLILDLANPRRYLEVRGRARVAPDPEYAYAAKFGEKYGMDLSGIDPPGQTRFVVTIEPEKVYAVDLSR